MTTTATTLSGTITGPKSIAATAALNTDFMSTDDVEIVQETSAGVVTAMAPSTNYTLALDGTAPSTITLTFVTAIASGDSWHWRRKTTLDQQTALTALGTFPTASVERAFDKAILALQETSEVAKQQLLSFTFSSGWGEWSTSKPRFYKHNGLIYLQGAVTKTGTIDNEQMLALPAGYRPSFPRQFPVVVLAGGSTWSRENIQIHNSGAITKTEATSVVDPAIYLDGIVFKPA